MVGVEGGAARAGRDVSTSPREAKQSKESAGRLAPRDLRVLIESGAERRPRGDLRCCRCRDALTPRLPLQALLWLQLPDHGRRANCKQELKPPGFISAHTETFRAFCGHGGVGAQIRAGRGQVPLSYRRNHRGGKGTWCNADSGHDVETHTLDARGLPISVLRGLGRDAPGEMCAPRLCCACLPPPRKRPDGSTG